jgi:hypothetical protein
VRDIFYPKIEVSIFIYHRPTDAPSSSLVENPVQVVIPRAVYDYASMVNHTLENPRQNKLDHDVTAVLGSSDPPPGFGFLYPQFYYLEQKRPVPLKPLQVSISFFFFFILLIVYVTKKKASSEREINLYSSVTQIVTMLNNTHTQSFLFIQILKQKKKKKRKINIWLNNFYCFLFLTFFYINQVRKFYLRYVHFNFLLNF